MCGEKLAAMLPVSARRGSPPHVRGKVCGYAGKLCRNGITPACAGKRCGDKVKHCFHEDHPRACGEKIRKKRQANCTMGSPPHMRGKAVQVILVHVKEGITPEHAGKSCSAVVYSVCKEDHPRMCGEKKSRPGKAGELLGSPPHVRGKVSSSVVSPVSMRITPAHAGKRERAGKPRPGLQDHPRACGEKATLLSKNW